MIKNFLQELRIQRWDDHRYYHHSRINQSLHFVSAVSFLFAYVMLFFDPVVSALVGWLVSMTSRQAGHFFFEPKGYDHVNQATHEHKEDIKVGYNLRRKVVLMSIWAASPLVLFLDPTLFGLFDPWASFTDFARQVAKIWLAESWPDVEIPYRSPLGESLLARLRAAYTEKLVGKRLCDRFSGDGPNQTMQTTVDGAASNSFPVQWVDMKAGYVTQQRRVR